MKATALFSIIILFLLISSSITSAGQFYSYRDRVIICLVTLEHADANQLADVLAPFLSPHGNISAYPPTNALIIKDQPSVVKMLIKAVKGRPDLSECQNFDHVPEGTDK
jgi:type II secretory pathway component GspD/PulD (secretin)